MAMSSGSETPSKRWYSRMTRSSGLTVSPARMARSRPSTTRKSSVKPRRVRSSTAHATVRYPARRPAATPVAAIPPSPALGDPDRLDVRQLADAVLRQLASVAGTLDASEGHARVGLDHAVDEHGARLDLPREMLGAPAVLGPDRGAEAKGRVVGQADRIALVLRADDGRHRSKGLLVESGHALVHAGEQGRRVEGSFAGRNLAAEQALGAALDCLLHLPVQIVAEIGPCLRAYLRLARRRISHPPRAELVQEQVEEPVGDGLDGNEPLGGDAALAAVDEPRIRRGLRGRGQI